MGLNFGSPACYLFDGVDLAAVEAVAAARAKLRGQAHLERNVCLFGLGRIATFAHAMPAGKHRRVSSQPAGRSRIELVLVPTLQMAIGERAMIVS